MWGKYSRFKKIRIIKKEEREFKNRRRKKKGGKGEHPTELQKPNVEADIYNNNRKCDWIYTHNQNQNSPTKIKYNRFWPSKQRKLKILSTRTKLIKVQPENKTKARCQLGDKAMKIKLTNILRGKERKKRKQE